MIVERRDGSLLMLRRTRYGIGKSFSLDSGKTWSQVVDSGIPHVSSRFFVRRLHSGNLLLVRHQSMKSTDENGKPRKLKRTHLTAFLSDDDGETWKGGLVLEKRACSYPDGFQAPDGTISIIYDYERRAAKMILLARFAEEDILVGRFGSPCSKKRIRVDQATGVITEEISWERLRIQDGEKENLIFTGI